MIYYRSVFILLVLVILLLEYFLFSFRKILLNILNYIDARVLCNLLFYDCSSNQTHTSYDPYKHFDKNVLSN